MKSDLPKVLHEVAGKPMLDYVIDAVTAVNAKAYVVVGHQAELVQERCARPGINFVPQHEQLGSPFAHPTRDTPGVSLTP